MKQKLAACVAVIFLLACVGCGKQTPQDGTPASSEDISLSVADIAEKAEDMFTKRDRNADYDATAAVPIVLNGDSAACDSAAVNISGSKVTITEDGVYLLSGTLNNGCVVVDADDSAKPQLILNGVTVISADSAALYIVESDKVVVTLAEGTENRLENGGTFDEAEDDRVDGTVFSKQDLSFNGTGSLTVISPAGHGIVGKDDLVFAGGTYAVSAASHAIQANDSVRITESALTLVAGKDGVHAENDEDAEKGFVYVADGRLDIEAEGDGLSAGSYMHLADGTFTVTAGGGSANGSKDHSDSYGGFMGGFGGGGMGGGFGGGGHEMRPDRMAQMTDISDTADSGTSMKGLKAQGTLLIEAGDFTINAADDAVHSNGSITVAGGVFTVATGDDGFHADETLSISAGTITISECYEGLEARHVLVSGGDITLTAEDDGLNAAGGKDASGMTGGRDGMFGGRGDATSSNGTIVISGGNLNITASGDGIDANGTLTISGGCTVVTGPTQGDTATLDYDVSGVITGGTFVGTGASGMAQSFSDSEQGVLAVRLNEQAAETAITVKDSAGKVLVSHTPSLAFEVIIISTPELVSGETYTVCVGTQTEPVTAG